MTDDLGFGIVHTETHKELVHGCLLYLGAGVGRLAVSIQSAFITDANAVGVVAEGMGTGLALGTTGIEHAVAGDVIVVVFQVSFFIVDIKY